MGELALHFTNHPILAGGLVALIVAVVLFEIRTRSHGQVQVAPADAVRLMNGGAAVIDVRSAEAFGAGHIVNARHVELDKIAADNAALKKFRNKPVIAVCENGLTSNRAAAKLREAGIEKAYSLKGGLNGWRAENLPLVK